MSNYSGMTTVMINIHHVMILPQITKNPSLQLYLKKMSPIELFCLLFSCWCTCLNFLINVRFCGLVFLLCGFAFCHFYCVARCGWINLDQLHDVPVHALSNRDFLDKFVRVLWSCARRSHQYAKQGVEWYICVMPPFEGLLHLPSLLANPKSMILTNVPVLSTHTMFSGLRSRCTMFCWCMKATPSRICCT